jgi:hypothetical protein
MNNRGHDILPDPPHAWERKNFATLPEAMSAEQRAEKETDRGLTKPIEQLLCDVHELVERGSPSGDMGSYPVQAMLHAQKHMVTMMAKVALANEHLAKSNDRLTKIGLWFASIATVMAIIQAATGIMSILASK